MTENANRAFPKQITLYVMSIVESEGHINGNDSMVKVYTSAEEMVNKTYPHYEASRKQAEEEECLDDSDDELLTEQEFQRELLSHGSVGVQCHHCHTSYEFFRQELTIVPSREVAAQMPALKDRDAELEELWEALADIPMDPATEKTEAPFLHFEAGADREDIWHWFDQRHSKGIAYLLYREDASRTPESAKLCYLNQLCHECGSLDCTYNHHGQCRFALVHEHKPEINDIDGCVDYEYTEGSA